MVNASGVVLTKGKYMPWGSSRSGAVDGDTPTTYRFTGQRSAEAELGLYYYGARWYDSYLNRWCQADSIIPSANGSYSHLTVDYHETQFLNQLNQENRKRLEDPQAKTPPVPTNPLAFDRYSYSYNNPLVYSDPDGHFAFLVPLIAGAIIGGGISTATYLIASKATGQDPTWAGAAGAFAGGVVAGAVSVIATPLAGTLLGAAGISATGTALVAGTAAVNAAGGAASYLAGGYTQNAVDVAMGNTPTFEPTVGGTLINAGVAGALSPAVGKVFPVANNTMSTLSQANCFMPGRTVGTLLATQNARNMYSQALIATGIGFYAGWEYGRGR
jgi:RHS repeat-associated protein